MSQGTLPQEANALRNKAGRITRSLQGHLRSSGFADDNATDLYGTDVLGLARQVSASAATASNLAKAGDSAAAAQQLAQARQSWEALLEHTRPAGTTSRDEVARLAAAVLAGNVPPALETATTMTLLEVLVAVLDGYKLQVRQAQQEEERLRHELAQREHALHANLQQRNSLSQNLQRRLHELEEKGALGSAEYRALQDRHAKLVAEAQRRQQEAEQQLERQRQQIDASKAMLHRLARQHHALHARLADSMSHALGQATLSPARAARNTEEDAKCKRDRGVIDSNTSKVKALQNKLGRLQRNSGKLLQVASSRASTATAAVLGDIQTALAELDAKMAKARTTCALATEWVDKQMPDVNALLNELGQRLADVNEDVLGAVRVCVRVRRDDSHRNQQSVQVGPDRQVAMNCGERGVFGPFFAVYDDQSTTEDLFRGSAGSNGQQRSSLRDVLSRVASGYSVVLFGYGASGSGKSFTLLGKFSETKPTHGLLHMALHDLKDRGVSQVVLKEAFELYHGAVELPTERVTGKVAWLTDPNQALQRALGEAGGGTLEASRARLPTAPLVPGADDMDRRLTELLTSINNHRKNPTHSKDPKQHQGRIRATPNNPESSRSHLFLVFEVQRKPGEQPGYLTIVDMAGRESPLTILRQKQPELTAKEADARLITLLSSASGEKEVELATMLKEGVYINETLNHLVYFLRKRAHLDPLRRMRSLSNRDPESHPIARQVATGPAIRPSVRGSQVATHLDAPPKQHRNTTRLPARYATDMTFVNPKDEDEGPPKRINNCLMIPVLKHLEGIGAAGDAKPAKFVMLCMVQQGAPGDTNCRENLECLRFADSINSSKV